MTPRVMYRFGFGFLALAYFCLLGSIWLPVTGAGGAIIFGWMAVVFSYRYHSLPKDIVKKDSK